MRRRGSRLRGLAVNTIPNTFIGGMATDVPTKASLAQLIGVSESNIPVFQIVGNDVEARVNQGYNTGSNFLWTNGNLTWWKDLDSHWKSAGSITFRYCPIIEVIANGLVTIGSQFCRNSPLAKLELNSLTVVESYFIENSQVKELILPSVTQFNGLSVPRNTELIYAPNCKFFGADLTNNDVFFYAKSGLKIYVHKDLDPSDADIADAQSKGVSVIRILNTTAPSTVTNLSIGTKYATVLQLNFTPPSSLNAIDHYECYANGIKKNNITESGGYVTGLEPETTYNITLIAVDIYYNKSGFSNTTTTTTTTTNSFPVDGLVSYYKMEDTAGTQLIDSWGSNHGTNNGATIGVPGKIGNSYSFDGSNDYINFPEFQSITQGDFTIALWAKQTVNSLPAVFSQGIPASWASNLFIFYIGESNNEVRVYWNDITALSYVGQVGTSNEFRHYVLRKTGTTLQLFKNNILVASGTTNSGAWTSTSQTIGCAKNNNTFTQFYKGILDEPAIYDKAISDAEISDIYNNANGLTI